MIRPRMIIIRVGTKEVTKRRSTKVISYIIGNKRTTRRRAKLINDRK